MPVKLDADKLEKHLALGTLSKADLRNFVKLLKPIEKFKIDDILINGIPPIPDVLTATVRVDAATVPALTKELAGIRDASLRGWRVFPKGIPVPAIFQVEIEMGKVRR
jgi:hypothetical protein